MSQNFGTTYLEMSISTFFDNYPLFLMITLFFGYMTCQVSAWLRVFISIDRFN